MGKILLAIERMLIFAIGILVVWIIASGLFIPLEKRFPTALAVALTYFAAAYILIPIAIRVTTFFLRHRRIPRFSFTGDGLHGDPVMLVLKGTEGQLREAFKTAGWVEPDHLNARSGLKMLVTFLSNRSYPNAPFSSLYLFGRRQDIGFQQQIGESPRKRHHVRFWAASIDPQDDPANTHYWTKHHPLDATHEYYWVGAGTKEKGLGFHSLTYQFAHSSYRDIDEEREHIFSELQKAGWIAESAYFDPGQPVEGKFTSDGRILTARLVRPGTEKSEL